MKKLFLTQHAQDAIDEREINPAWIERAVRAPDWTRPDPRRAAWSGGFSPFPNMATACCASHAMKPRSKSVY
jgi:hypothetical protein